MKTFAFPSRRYEGGVAAVEFAVVLPVMVLLLAFTLFFGRVYWHYNVALKAAHDAATVLALARKIEIGVSKADLGEVEIANLARTVALSELKEVNPGQGTLPVIDVSCDNIKCIGEKLPGQVSVTVRMKMVDVYFSNFTDEMLGTKGLWLYAEVRVPYVGF